MVDLPSGKSTTSQNSPKMLGPPTSTAGCVVAAAASVSSYLSDISVSLTRAVDTSVMAVASVHAVLGDMESNTCTHHDT